MAKKTKETDFEELMKNIDFTRWLQALIPVMQPIIVFGTWLAFSKIDNRADALSKLITLVEPIPTVDLNIPPPVVLASLYHSVDELADVIEKVIEFMEDLDIPGAKEIIHDIKEELLPEPIKPQEILSDFNDCVKGYKRDIPSLLKSKYSKGLYIQGCLIRKGWAQKAILEIIREKLE